MGYSGLLWVIPGYYGVLSYRFYIYDIENGNKQALHQARAGNKV